MKVIDNFNLDKLNTLHLQSIAKYYFELNSITQLNELKDYVKTFKHDYFILGGGSNLILPKLYNGLVIHNCLKGISIDEQDQYNYVSVYAGEVWDEFVQYTIDNGCYGLENLSLIPGSVGASPVQNIGAYGVEVKDFIDSVTVFDFITGEIKVFNNQDCEFKYRDSMFKRNSNYLIISVTFRLLKTAKLNITYGDLAKSMANYTNPTALNLRNEVIKIRSSKLPDPKVIGNVGSFFHNPILCNEHADSLKEKYPNLPIYLVDEQHKKVSAGWLIDNLGLKGFILGKMGVYDKQALVLVNKGGANKSDVMTIAQHIIQKVYDEYQVKLNIEPIQI